MAPLFIGILFLGCFEDEKPKSKKTVKTLVNKVIKTKDSNKTLSQEIQDDGIVIDGGRDEELLDAFGLAVSQAIVEDGVSVPDCIALENTGYLTKEECDEISQKYFGFYTIGENGDASKVDDVFKNGVAGGDIKIKDSDIEFFDSSGNPLLDNQVEFEDVVSASDDLQFLNKLKASIPSNKVSALATVNAKIDFIETSNVEIAAMAVAKISVQKVAANTASVDIATFNSSLVDSNIDNNDVDLNIDTIQRKLSSLKNQHIKTENELNLFPDNQRLRDKYNDELSEIAILESQLQ